MIVALEFIYIHDVKESAKVVVPFIVFFLDEKQLRWSLLMNGTIGSKSLPQVCFPHFRGQCLGTELLEGLSC